MAGRSKVLALQVARAREGDIDQGLVRIEPSIMQENELETGDIIEISPEREGGRRTAAFVVPARREDRGKRIIRMDGLIRHNAGIFPGEMVKIKRVTKQIARSVTAAPIRENIKLMVKPRILKIRLQRHPVSKGDEFVITGRVRYVLLEGRLQYSGLNRVGLVVVSTDPEGIVVVGRSTRFQILPFVHVDFVSTSGPDFYGIPLTWSIRESEITDTYSYLDLPSNVSYVPLFFLFVVSFLLILLVIIFM